MNTPQEEQDVIARVLSPDKFGSQDTGGSEVRKIQVELGGHVFVSQRRVGRRSLWYLRSMGVLAEPFNLRNVHHAEITSNVNPNHSEVELGLMSE